MRRGARRRARGAQTISSINDESWRALLVDLKGRLMPYSNLRGAAEERGFTLVELLVVIVILGILIAIAVPTFLSQQNKADDASATTGLNTAYKNAVADATSNNDGNFQGAASEVSSISANEPELRPVSTAQSVSDVTDPGTLYVIADGTPGDDGDFEAAEKSPSGDICVLKVTGHVLAAPTCNPSSGGDSGTGGGGTGGVSSDTCSSIGTQTGGTDSVTNLVGSPSFEYGASFWTFDHDSGLAIVGDGCAGYSAFTLTTTADSPPPDPDAGSAYGQEPDTGAMYLLLPGDGADLDASTSYTCSEFVKGDEASVGNKMDLSLEFGGPITSSWSTVASTAFTLTDGWQRIYVTGSTPANGDPIEGACALAPPDSSSPSSTIYFDGAMVTKGSSLYPYFDGDILGNWTGAPGNSVSTATVSPE